MSSTDKPLVSVVMATYNTEYAMLREAVESLIDQTYSNWELILIDDCSDKFNDFSFLDEYKDSRIKLYHNEENLGCTKCFNKGIRLAQGEYIARLDADDIALPKRFEVQVKYMERHPDVKVVSSISYIFGTTSGLNLVIPNRDGYMKAVSLFRNIMAHSSVLYRRDLFDVDQMYYDESFVHGQDYELFVRILNKGYKIRQCNKCLVMIRNHEAQISSSDQRRSIQSDNLAKVRERQLREHYDVTDRDVLCEDLLLRCISRDGVTEEEMFTFIRKILKENRTSARLSQHYLKLALAEKISAYVKTGSKRAAAFLIRTMPLEALQMMFILIYRKILFLIYSFVLPYPRQTCKAES